MVLSTETLLPLIEPLTCVPYSIAVNSTLGPNSENPEMKGNPGPSNPVENWRIQSNLLVTSPRLQQFDLAAERQTPGPGQSRRVAWGLPEKDGNNLVS